MIHPQLLVEYLHRRFGELTGADAAIADRIFGGELPDEVIQRLRQDDAEPAICLMSMGGPARSGILTMEVRRYDIHVITQSFAESHRIDRLLRDFMEEIAEGAGAVDNLRSAVREGGPNEYRTEDYRRPIVASSWIVAMSGDLP